jgi:hypothetical protein
VPAATGTSGAPPNAPSSRARLGFAAVVAAATAVYVYFYATHNPHLTSDFDQVWAAARALWQRENPYDVIGYAKPFYWWWPFYYPLPAAVLVAPLGLLPVIAARCVFTGLSAGLLAWAITRDGWARLTIFLSIPFFVSIELAQWAPLLTAALLVPALCWMGIAKPNWGVAIVAAASSPRIWKPLAIGGGALIAAAFALQPGWVGDWLSKVRSARHFVVPLTLPLGFLMLGAALRWRRPEARLLLAMACLPQTPGFYDALMLFMIPRTSRESLALTVLTFVVFFAMAFSGPWPSGDAWMHDIARFTLWFLYLPCVALVLTRPNEGTLPVSWPGRAVSGAGGA